MTDTPTTPEACRAEQEKLLKQVSETESQNWSLMVEVRMGKSRLLIVDGDEEGIAEVRGKKNADFIAQAPTLVRQYAALLAAHAEALERLKELREALVNACIPLATLVLVEEEKSRLSPELRAAVQQALEAEREALKLWSQP